jgi:amino acid transporter
VSIVDRVRRFLFGKPRDLSDPGVFHRMSLVAFLAWVGLGADGLSSSTYGPEETFRMLAGHPHLAVALAAAMVFTIAVISYAYSRIIEHFPMGGGGYMIATRLLGPKAGLVSGSALIVDYILTISVSIAAAGDAFFSFLPLEWQPWKLPVALAAIVLLTVLNLRGVKESVEVLLPVFLTFLVTHAVLIGGAILLNAGNMPEVAHGVREGFRADLATIGWAGVLALCLRAYAFGCGTYTGIEAVSNGLSIMREPKVETGRRTMLYMAVSLAVTASGLVLAYLLLDIRPVEGRTMNASLAQAFADAVFGPGASVGRGFLLLTLVSETLLLVIAAQAGFIDGPRVMANMALDSWLPRRLAGLSDRLTTQDGILLMSAAAAATMFYAHGHTATLIVMYSINVFVTFTLSEASMIRFWLQERAAHPDWRRKMSVHLVGFVLCVTILAVNLYEKFFEGGWVTLAITAALIGACALIRRHYDEVRGKIARVERILSDLPAEPGRSAPALDPKAPTAVLLVGGSAGLATHSLLTILRLFPNHFRNFVFVSVGVVDSAVFKEGAVVDEVRRDTKVLLDRHLETARRLGLAAEARASVGVDVQDEAVRLCGELRKEYPRAVFFAGKLIFEKEGLFDRFLHNDNAYGLQRRLQFDGLNAMVLPIRVMDALPTG